jgi:3-deoxy-manno-octulosonate cytidylyltransferase (CMP-KDO synthetase)
MCNLTLASSIYHLSDRNFVLTAVFLHSHFIISLCLQHRISGIMVSFIAIIPARFASSRLPGKPLANIHGKPMIAHVVGRAKYSGAKRTIVATDHIEIAAAAQQAGAETCMTRTDHQSGTERLAEVVETYGLADEEIIVNVQGDEPMIAPEFIAQVAHDLASCSGDVATLAAPLNDKELAFDPSIVKVVLDVNGYALYFSRAAIPWDRDGIADQLEANEGIMLRHIGLYAYRAGFLRKYITWKPSLLERIEILEQLRILWHGGKIHVSIASSIATISIDTAEDLENIRRLDPRCFDRVMDEEE